jgi:acylphosphatase
MAERLVLRLRITGRVQGVGYRDWAVAQARSMGVDGWVRNRADGSVEALAAGDATLVEAFILRLQTGPRLAGVSAVERERAEPPAEPGFRKLPTL